jgi:hypothetical protein
MSQYVAPNAETNVSKTTSTGTVISRYVFDSISTSGPQSRTSYYRVKGTQSAESGLRIYRQICPRKLLLADCEDILCQRPVYVRSRVLCHKCRSWSVFKCKFIKRSYRAFHVARFKDGGVINL